MTATLESIAAALDAACSSVVTAGKAKSADRFVADPQQPLVDQILAAVGNRNPALLVMLDSAQGANDFESLSGVDEETVETSTWAVLCCVVDTRQAKPATQGTTGTIGVYALADAVQAACANLDIDGLHRSKRLRYRDVKWLLPKPGKVYVLAVRFTADRVLADAPTVDLSAPFNEIDADLNLGTSTDPQVDPLGQVRVDLTLP